MITLKIVMKILLVFSNGYKYLPMKIQTAVKVYAIKKTSNKIINSILK